MTEVWMLYTGIISFWQDPGKGDVWLFAPDARSSDHPHLGWVLAPSSQVGDASEACDEIETTEMADRGLRAFEIFNWIEPQLDPEDLDQEEGVTLVPGFRQRLVDLADLNPNVRPRLNWKVIGKVPETPRLTLFKSRLRYGSLTAVAVDKQCRWRFQHQEDHEAKVLAQAVAHRFVIDSDSLIVKFGDACSLTLNAQSIFPFGDVILIVIGNTMKADMLASNNLPSEKDEHVLLYHRLAAQAGQPGASPLVCVEAESDELPQDLRFNGPVRWWPRSIDGANCPPAWWDSSSSP